MTLGTRLTLATGLLLATVALIPASALAAGEGPGWELSGVSAPTNLTLPTGGVSGTIVLSEFNVGAASSHGTVTVTDRLPAGLKAADAGEVAEHSGVGGGLSFAIEHSLWTCVGNGPGAPPKLSEATVVTCANNSANLPEIPGGAGNPTDSKPQGPHLMPKIGITVNAQPGAEEHEINRATIAGGGAPAPASTEDPVTISSALPSSGVVGWDGWFSNADGTLDTQAGSHPYAFTTTFALATQLTSAGGGVFLTGGEIRNVEVALPPGVVGNPNAVPQCSRAAFDGERCPALSEIGVVTLFTGSLAGVGLELWNLVPPPGVPAEFGFTLTNVHSLLDASVRSGGDYGITEQARNLAQKEAVEVVTTVWGDPGDPSHNIWRSGATGGCFKADEERPGEICAGSERPILNPFLTLPTACGKPLPFVLHTTTWTGEKRESVFYSHDSNGPGSSESDPSATGFTGCGNLAFGPTFTTTPDTSSADTPTGLAVDVKPPLGGLEAVEGDGSADIAGTTATLPPGFVVNPGQAAGLQACGPSEDGLTTGAERSRGEEDNGPPSCPNASKVGTVTAKSPLLEGAAEKELSGNVYVLQSNPPDVKLLAAFSADGVNVKLVLDAVLNEQTGQITTKVVNVPQFPVGDFKLTFEGGTKAALDTPTKCGTYTTNADFIPWSSPFAADAFPSAGFAITTGPGGGPCVSSPMPFGPSLTAGSSNGLAGMYSSFSALLTREDGTQRIVKAQATGPAGVDAMISHVQQCTSAQAAADACPEAAKIGHVIVAAGPGSDPLVVPQPGQPQAPIYLTESYEGAPFGFLIKIPLKVGPFELPTQVVRGKFEVNPVSAQVTVNTDPLPQIINGVPVDMRSAYFVLDRSEFVFNPTNCSPQQIAGTAAGASPPGEAGAGAAAPLSSSFDVSSCRELAFHPKFAASTGGRASKAGGASLDVKVAASGGPQAGGSEANIKAVKVDLPKQLPSRLTTLQKACLARVFDANPAACPKESSVGTAIAVTPVLAHPLVGPAYLVSHGGAAFPDLEIVLQGEGITLLLDGHTHIKHGITTSDFETVPDAPIKSFELKLPTGKFSVLSPFLPAKARFSFCGQKLTMPTMITAQNGAVLKQTTKIGVTSCPRLQKHKSKRVNKKHTHGSSRK